MANQKWFPGPTAKIILREVDRNDEYLCKHFPDFPYFDTWGGAHNYLIARAVDNVVRAERALEAEQINLAKVTAMQDPYSVEAA